MAARETTQTTRFAPNGRFNEPMKNNLNYLFIPITFGMTLQRMVVINTLEVISVTREFPKPVLGPPPQHYTRITVGR